VNFKTFLLYSILVITSCTISDNSGTFKSSPTIFSVIKTGDLGCNVIIDSTIDISASAPESTLFIFDAEVFLNNSPAVIVNVEDESLGYNYVYRIDTYIEGEKEYLLTAIIGKDTFFTKTTTPKNIEFRYIADSIVLNLDTMTFLMWNRSGIDFYFLQFYEHTDSGLVSSFGMGVENDTIAMLFPFSLFFTDSAVYDVSIMAMDSNYMQLLMGAGSSFGENTYGFFSSVSVDILQNIQIVK